MNMYLKSVKVNTDNHYFFQKDYQIDNLKNITLLVGDQGCGKSSLLSLLSENKNIDVQLTDKGKKGTNTFYFDFENENPRVMPDYKLADPQGRSLRYGTGVKLLSFFESHGETLLQFSVNGLKQAKDCIIFFDEPESALSLKNQYNLIKECKEAVERNCQLIFATHCLPLIQSQKKVFSMEHNKWMLSQDFIETQLI